MKMELPMQIPTHTHGLPMVVTAFGTTTRAMETYDKMDAVFRSVFPDNPIHWAYSSRMVKHAMKKKKNLMDPLETLAMLEAQGHKWAMIQSLHLICGHEFDRLKDERLDLGIRTGMGLPLLTSHLDYLEAAYALTPVISKDPTTATVLVGHGTDHPAWAAYPALESVLRKEYGPSVYVGVVEEEPGMDVILERILTAGHTRVHLVPFMLVAGVHFKEDLTREEDAWQRTFERNGLQVSVHDQGMGHLEMITRIFCRHMAEGLDIIPV